MTKYWFTLNKTVNFISMAAFPPTAKIAESANNSDFLPLEFIEWQGKKKMLLFVDDIGRSRPGLWKVADRLTSWVSRDRAVTITMLSGTDVHEKPPTWHVGQIIFCFLCWSRLLASYEHVSHRCCLHIYPSCYTWTLCDKISVKQMVWMHKQKLNHFFVLVFFFKTFLQTHHPKAQVTWLKVSAREAQRRDSLSVLRRLGHDYTTTACQLGRSQCMTQTYSRDRCTLIFLWYICIFKNCNKKNVPILTIHLQ